MKSPRREYLLIAAFMLCVVFTYAMRAYMGIAAGTEKNAQVYLWNMAGTLFGALILPLLLPLSYLRYGELRNCRCPPRALFSGKHSLPWKARLIVTAFFFLPSSVVRFLIPEAVYLANAGISAFASFGNGVGLVLISGCFFLLINTKRTLWAVLSTITGLFIFYLIQGQGRIFLMPFLFTGIGLVMAAAGVFVLVFLAPGFRPENEEPGIRNEKLEDHVRKHSLVPTQIDNEHQSLIPNFLFPLLAVLIIYSTSWADWLFIPSLNYPFDAGFNPFVVALLLLLALFGFLAGKEWERFLRFFIFLCAGLFVVSPSLLFFNRSETLFMILYTLKITATRMMTVVFPFVIVDSYWQDISSKDKPSSGYWCWLLSISVYSINVGSISLGILFKDRQFDNAYAVLVLSLSAIVFFILCLKVIPKNKEIVPLPPIILSPAIDDIFREHNLTEREKEVALLMVREGLSNEEIGERLFISIPTVKSHVSQIYRKFGVKSRAAFLVKVKK